MLIKNVSVRIINLEDFPEERPLVPGAHIDLSKYPVAQRETSQQLKNLFTKGELLCLGRASVDTRLQQPSVSKTILGKYEFKNETLYEGQVSIPSTQLQPQVTSFSRNRTLNEVTTVPHRYDADALKRYAAEAEQVNEGIVPAFTEKTFEEDKPKSFVQVQSEDEVYTIQIDPKTGVKYSEPFSPGKNKDFSRDPSVFVDKLMYNLKDDDTIEPIEKQKLRDKVNEKIVQLVQNKCLATRTNGTPCERAIVNGFRTCFHHMSPIDKLRYLELKKKTPPNENASKPS